MRPWATALIGFGLVFPVRLLDGVNVRLCDVVAVLLACAAGLALAGGGPRGRSVQWPYFAVALLTIGWVGVDFTCRAYLPFRPATSIILLRWVVAVPGAYYLAVLTRDKACRKWLVLGVVAGCLATNGLTVSDLITYRLTGRPQFLLEDNTGLIKNDYRAGGILDGSNGAAIAGLFLVPFLIGAAEEFGCHALALLVSIPTICAVFYATQSRGALLVSLGLVLLWGLIRRPAALVGPLAVLSVVAALFVLGGSDLKVPGSSGASFTDILAARFSNDTALEGNVADRTETTMSSLGMVFEHPLGMGATYEAPLDQVTGFDATHNALTQLALMGGLPLATLVAVILGWAAIRLFWASSRIEHWTALYVLAVSMFESAFFNPFFSFLVLWVISQSLMQDAEPALSGSHEIRHRAPARNTNAS